MTKLIDLEALATLREDYRRDGRRVVWTNGCFDIVHAGHVASLNAAKALGDILVVGLNSDASVSGLKGAERPFVAEKQRAVVVSELQCVDHVVLFDEPRCIRQLEALRPEVYAKGSDYTLETIDQDERRAVEGGGGSVAFLPFVEGLSTSLLVKKIRRADPEKIISGAFALIRDDRGRLLLVANRYGEGVRWGLPGGGHHRWESLEQTVARETLEETGLEVRVTRYAGLIERIDRSLPLHLLCHQFEAEVTGGTLRIDPREEHVIDARWLTAAEVESLPAVVLGRKHLLRYLADPAAYPPYIRMVEGEE